MKKTIKLAVVAALALGATSAFATNGSTMIGAGGKTRGMAGVGIGMGHGAESALVNPALITTIAKDTEVSFGGTLFMPEVETTNTMGPMTNTSKSDADKFVVPSVSISTKLNDNFYIGVGMWGTGGLGVDHRETANNLGGGTHMQMVTALQLMQFGVPLVYTVSDFAVGITPIIQYGSLDINFNPGVNIGAGSADDLSFGYNLGLSYEIAGVTLGAVYKSEIEMEYKGQLSTAIGAMTGIPLLSDTLSTPAEYGVGVSYEISGHTMALDYKRIAWEDANGYQDFGWEDQDVFAIGYEYATDAFGVRLGYSHADSAVQDNAAKMLPLDQIMPNLTNTFNALGFPGNVETHYAVGGTYNVTEMVSIDLAAVYAPKATTSTVNFMMQPITTTHSETSYSFQVNLDF